MKSLFLIVGLVLSQSAFAQNKSNQTFKITQSHNEGPSQAGNNNLLFDYSSHITNVYQKRDNSSISLLKEIAKKIDAKHKIFTKTNYDKFEQDAQHLFEQERDEELTRLLEFFLKELKQFENAEEYIGKIYSLMSINNLVNYRFAESIDDIETALKYDPKNIYYASCKAVLLQQAFGRSDSAVKFLARYISIAKNDTARATLYNTLGNLSFNHENYSDAKKYLDYEILIQEKNSYFSAKDRKAIIYNAKAMLFDKTSDSISSISNFNLALNEYKILGDSAALVNMYATIGDFYLGRNNLYLSKKYFEIALNISKSYTQYNWSHIFLCMARYYCQNKNPDSLQKYYRLSIAETNKEKGKFQAVNKATLMLELAISLKKVNEEEQALFYTNELLTTLDKFPELEHLPTKFMAYGLAGMCYSGLIIPDRQIPNNSRKYFVPKKSSQGYEMYRQSMTIMDQLGWKDAPYERICEDAGIFAVSIGLDEQGETYLSRTSFYKSFSNLQKARFYKNIGLDFWGNRYCSEAINLYYRALDYVQKEYDFKTNEELYLIYQHLSFAYKAMGNNSEYFRYRNLVHDGYQYLQKSTIQYLKETETLNQKFRNSCN